MQSSRYIAIRRRLLRYIVPMAAPLLSRQRAERAVSSAQGSRGREAVVGPPSAPSSPGPPQHGGAPSSSSEAPDLSVVFDITKGAVDMQFRIAERLDSKARNYFAAAATVFGVVQALTLNDAVRNALGGHADEVRWLTLGAAFALAVTLLASVRAIRPRDEYEFEPEQLRELLSRSYVDPKAPADAVNDLIGVLDLRMEANEGRVEDLKIVTSIAAISAFLSITQLVFVVQALL
jgi:hypothetical protein